MPSNPHKVYLVVDREFGEKLAELEQNIPVWIVDTPSNKPVAQRLWKNYSDTNHLTGVTTFVDTASLTPDELVRSHLNSLDLHHGPYSANPPWTVIEVIGAQLTPETKAELATFGCNDFQPTPRGFIATRPLPTE